MKILKLTLWQNANTGPTWQHENPTIYLAASVIQQMTRWTKPNQAPWTEIIIGPENYLQVNETPEEIIAQIEGKKEALVSQPKLIDYIINVVAKQRANISNFDDFQLEEIQSFLESFKGVDINDV